MQKPLRYVTACWVIVSVLVFCGYPVFALETEGWIPQIEILTPGMRRTFDITQEQNFPFEFSQFLVLALGHGTLAISLTNTDNKDGYFLILAGVGISAAGIIPVFKWGITKVQFNPKVTIGNELSPYGALWISFWGYSLGDDPESEEDNPPYNYQLQLSMF